jgi:hypothetical protein
MCFQKNTSQQKFSQLSELISSDFAYNGFTSVVARAQTESTFFS